MTFASGSYNEQQLARNKVAVVNYGNGAKLPIKFMWKLKKSAFHPDGLINGKPGGRELYCMIYCSKNQEVYKKVNEQIKQEYAAEYSAFIASEENRVVGLPLEMAPFIDDAAKEMLNYFKIYTLEQLAAAHDGRIQEFGMGGRQLRDKAIEFLEKTRSAAPLAKIEAENTALKAQMLAMQEQLNLMASTQAGKKKPGRPKKCVEPEQQAA